MASEHEGAQQFNNLPVSMAHSVPIRPMPEFNPDAELGASVAIHVGKTGSQTLTCFYWLVTLRILNDNEPCCYTKLAQEYAKFLNNWMDGWMDGWINFI